MGGDAGEEFRKETPEPTGFVPQWIRGAVPTYYVAGTRSKEASMWDSSEGVVGVLFLGLELGLLLILLLLLNEYVLVHLHGLSLGVGVLAFGIVLDLLDGARGSLLGAGLGDDSTVGGVVVLGSSLLAATAAGILGGGALARTGGLVGGSRGGAVTLGVALFELPDDLLGPVLSCLRRSVVGLDHDARCSV